MTRLLVISQQEKQCQNKWYTNNVFVQWIAALAIMACVHFIESLQIAQCQKQEKLETGLSRAGGFTTLTRSIFFFWDPTAS